MHYNWNWSIFWKRRSMISVLTWTPCWQSEMDVYFVHISLDHGARHRYCNRHDSCHAEQMGGPRSQWLR